MPSIEPDQTALGAAIRAIREEQGLSQNRLAETTGLTQGWLSDTENGRRNPSWSSLIRLARGLGISIGELVARAEALAGKSDTSR
jgi:transcriptional regulator with XRE-family HTH domain